MKTENDFLLELIDLIFIGGINEQTCEFIHRETGIVDGLVLEPTFPMTGGAIQLCKDIYSMCIGEIAMGYKVTNKDNEDMIDEITNYILLYNRG